VSHQYLFGDSNTAAQRLKLLASVYQESTRAFLTNAAGSARFHLGLDLGCGLGLTTNLIAETLRCDRVIGLDTSATFIKLARATAGGRMSLIQHDITATPFPGGNANLIFSRFLLTHLRDPAAVVTKWATQLEGGGLLLLEETEAIHTANPVFTRYLRIVEAMLAEQSNQLYAGRMVASLASPGGLKSTVSELHGLPVRNSDAARMFASNLNALKDSESVRTNYSSRVRLALERVLLALENELRQIAAIESPARQIEWEMRQSAWLKE